MENAEEYKIIRKNNRKKSILFKIEDGVLNIYAPLNIKDKSIEELYQKNKHKFIKKIEIEKNNKDYINLFGKKLLIFKEYSNLLIKPYFEIKNKIFFEYLPTKILDSEIKKYLKIWKTELIKKIINFKIYYFVKKYKFNFIIGENSIKIGDSQTKWGSCSFKNNLNFNYKIIEKRNELIDYLVLHELTHSLIKNHSIEFWNKLESFCPNSKMRKTELKKG